jgi:hypothetical protein
MTPGAQAPAEAREGYVTYDELPGPRLHAARWSPARLPLPTGGEHLALDPNAELAVREGEVRVDDPALLADPQRQAPRLLDPAVRAAGGSTGDVCRRHGGPEHRPGAGRLAPGMASFAVFDLEASKRVFAVDGTSTRVFAMHEQVGVGAGRAAEPFYHVIESPYEDFDDDFTRLRACEITLDRSGSTAIWWHRFRVRGVDA